MSSLLWWHILPVYYQPLQTWQPPGLQVTQLSSGTRLLRTPWGHAIVSVLSGCPYKAGTQKKNFMDSKLIDVKTHWQTEFLNFVPIRKFFLPPDHSKQTSLLLSQRVYWNLPLYNQFSYFYTVLKSTVLKRRMRVEPSGIKRKHQLRLTAVTTNTRSRIVFFLSIGETWVFVDVNQLFPWFSHALWEGSRVSEWRAKTHSRPQCSGSLSSTCAEELWVEIWRRL